MTTTTDDLMNRPMGRRSVAENIERSIEKGALIRHEDGMLELPAGEKSGQPYPWLHATGKAGSGDCSFHMRFLFHCAYDRSTVPYGCRNCYKVKVVPRTVRQLMALKDILQQIDCSSKCGTEIDLRYSQDIYSGFIYCRGLEKAREIFETMRAATASHPKLGPDVRMLIKRGCTEYEIFCGPSDKYTFRPELPELEKYLKNRFRKTPKAEKQPPSMTIMSWLQTAYRIGDDTYLDFTKGRRMYPKIVTYE